jgi:hypothetical protein
LHISFYYKSPNHRYYSYIYENGGGGRSHTMYK